MGTTEADPFAFFHSAPQGETALQKTQRLEREAEAQRVSDLIDEQLKAEKQAMKKNKYTVKVLLLGQSESGKSTTLKNFRMRYAREDWEEERASWRAVIQLNLIRSIITIVELIQDEIDIAAGLPPSSLNYYSNYYSAMHDSPTHDLSTDYPSTHYSSTHYSSPNSPTGELFFPPSPPSSPPPDLDDGDDSDSDSKSPDFTPTPIPPLSPLLIERHEVLKLRLGPLRRVQSELKRRLGEGAEEEVDGAADAVGVLGGCGHDQSQGYGNGQCNWQGNGQWKGSGQGQDGESHAHGQKLDIQTGYRMPRGEFSVNVHRLHDALQKGGSGLKPSLRRMGGGGRMGSGNANGKEGNVNGYGNANGHGNGHGNGNGKQGEANTNTNVIVDEATDVIASCREDMRNLWNDENVREVLRRSRIRLEETAGFFLDDLDRIARTDYEPSDDDVLRARLRTLGVQEYRIRFEPNSTSVFSAGIGGDVGKTWLLYDVGGSRTMRHAWIPFFDNIQAIIFLAPISCFDERLSEDSKVNRLEDSFMLWKSITKSNLLAKATMILFLNKCDLLKRKLRAGVRVRDHLPSYGDRANEVNGVIKYLREKFKEILKQHSSTQRAGYFYATSVIDTKATATTIKAVKDSILRHYLASAEFL